MLAQNQEPYWERYGGRHLVNMLCLPSKSSNKSLRPERTMHVTELDEPRRGPYYVHVMPANSHWHAAVGMIHGGICRGGDSVGVQAYVDQMEKFTAHDGAGGNRIDALRPFFQSVAVILYDKLCSGTGLARTAAMTRDEAEIRLAKALYRFKLNLSCNKVSPLHMRAIAMSVFEHMLLVDYGIGVYPVHAPLGCCFRRSWRHTWRVFNQFCHDLVEVAICCRRGQAPVGEDLARLASDILYIASGTQNPPGHGHGRGLKQVDNNNDNNIDMDISDFALMIHYYQTHTQLQPETALDCNDGLTGYTGVLQELIDEIPTRGAHRLQRKLSVDVNELIPKIVRDRSGRREKMMETAKGIAAQHGLSLEPLPRTVPDVFRGPGQEQQQQQQQPCADRPADPVPVLKEPEKKKNEKKGSRRERLRDKIKLLLLLDIPPPPPSFSSSSWSLFFDFSSKREANNNKARDKYACACRCQCQRACRQQRASQCPRGGGPSRTGTQAVTEGPEAQGRAENLASRTESAQTSPSSSSSPPSPLSCQGPNKPDLYYAW